MASLKCMDARVRYSEGFVAVDRSVFTGIGAGSTGTAVTGILRRALDQPLGVGRRVLRLRSTIRTRRSFLNTRLIRSLNTSSCSGSGFTHDRLTCRHAIAAPSGLGRAERALMPPVFARDVA